jgi:hypothetical protein
VEEDQGITAIPLMTGSCFFFIWFSSFPLGNTNGNPTGGNGVAIVVHLFNVQIYSGISAGRLNPQPEVSGSTVDKQGIPVNRVNILL